MYRPAKTGSHRHRSILKVAPVRLPALDNNRPVLDRARHLPAGLYSPPDAGKVMPVQFLQWSCIH